MNALTTADCEDAFAVMVPRWFLERLDTGLGTASVVPLVKSLPAGGSCGSCQDGPYSDGGNAEYWSRSVDRTGKGYEVTVVHHVRGGADTVLRQGVMPWNNVANRAILAACQLRREARREARVGEQILLFA